MSSASLDRQSSQSSIRLLQILECLSANRVPMRLQDIAKSVNMTQPTVLRYLYALIDANYIYQDEDSSRYALTWRVCQLSENLVSPLGLRNITTAFINRLANSLSLGVCLVVNQNDECMYLDCIDNPNSPTLQRIGKHAPLHATGSGKLLLSQLSDSQISDYINSNGLVKYTEHTITDGDVLLKEIDHIRQQGFAMDEEECEIGLRCISCPLYDYSRRIIAALSVFGNVQDMADFRIQNEIYPQLQNASTIISSRLGFQNGRS